MEILEKMQTWLMSYPGWGDRELCIDTTQAEPGSCGLFPAGLEQVNRRENVLGNVAEVWRCHFILRRIALRQEAAAAWLLDFQDWVRNQSLQGLSPRFGDVPSQERIRAEKGKLLSVSQTGTGTYELKLTAEYMKENEYEQD